MLLEECGRDVGEPDDLVRGLSVEFEVELGFRTTVIPGRERLQLRTPERVSGEVAAFDLDARARCLPLEILARRDRLRGRDDAARDEAAAAFVLAGEEKDHIADGDALAAVHRLLAGKTPRRR